MSATEHIHEQEAERPERAVLHREFSAEATVGDGRTIDLRIVPYGEVATVDDGRGAYRETFEAGAFDAQMTAAHRVYLNFQHERGIRSIVGKGHSLESRPDALYGSFRALEDADGDKALTLVREGVLTSVSLEFLPKKSVRTGDGIIKRVKAHLDAVALCRVGAYSGAAVLAVREEFSNEITLDEELLPVEMDPELVKRLRAQGVALPDRYQAHPEPADTPEHDEAGTSEDGTRQPTETTSLEE